MFPLSPTMWVYVAVGVLVLALGAGLRIQTSRLDAVKTEYATFKAEVKVLGVQAQLAADKQKASDIKKQERVNAENKVLRSTNATLSRELRDSRTSSSYVPPATASSTSPNIASFSRSELERAIKHLDAGVSRIVEKGDQARIDLDSAKVWAQEK